MPAKYIGTFEADHHISDVAFGDDCKLQIKDGINPAIAAITYRSDRFRGGLDAEPANATRYNCAI